MDLYPRFKYDNIINSMILGYIIASLEGWPDIMSEYVSSYFKNFIDEVWKIIWTLFCCKYFNFSLFLHEPICWSFILKFYGCDY